MSTKHEEKALQSILRGETPEKRVMIGNILYQIIIQKLSGILILI